MMISSGFFFHFFENLIWVKGQKIVQDNKKILSGALHISGIIHHMIFIYGTHV